MVFTDYEEGTVCRREGTVRGDQEVRTGTELECTVDQGKVKNRRKRRVKGQAETRDRCGKVKGKDEEEHQEHQEEEQGEDEMQREDEEKGEKESRKK